MAKIVHFSKIVVVFSFSAIIGSFLCQNFGVKVKM